MIYSLNGKVTAKLGDRAVLECGGVGFEVQMSRRGLDALAPVGENAFILTHLAVREDAFDLFGFCTADERDTFRQLINVSGVGPKMALSVLSELDPGELAAAVASGDSTLITRANGVGPKLAQRIVLELKDKLQGFGAVQVKTAPNTKGAAAKTVEAIDALMTLGFTQHEAKRAVTSMNVADMTVEDIIKTALKEMM